MKIFLSTLIISLLFIGCKPNVVRKTAQQLGDEAVEFFRSEKNVGKVLKAGYKGCKYGYEVYRNRCSQCGGVGRVSCGNCGASGQVPGMDPWGNFIVVPCPNCMGRGLPPSMPCNACQ